MMAFARAAYRMGKEGKIGGFTPFDVPLYYLSQRSREELIRDLL
jgi:diaminopimelate dehydrogenase